MTRALARRDDPEAHARPGRSRSAWRHAHGALVAGVDAGQPGGDVRHRAGRRHHSLRREGGRGARRAAHARGLDDRSARPSRSRSCVTARSKTFEVTVAQQAGDETRRRRTTTKASGVWRFAISAPNEREQRNLEAGEGVLVADVAADSPAAEAGITAGRRDPAGEPQVRHHGRTGEEGSRVHSRRKAAPPPRTPGRRQRTIRGADAAVNAAAIPPRWRPGATRTSRPLSQTATS